MCYTIRVYIDLGSGDSMAAWEGPIELLLAKVKNASGRIGIFLIKLRPLSIDRASLI